MIVEHDGGEIPKEKYLKDILTTAVAIEEVPSSSEYSEYGTFSPRSGRRKFGSWDNTISALGELVLGLRGSIELQAHRGRRLGVERYKDFLEEQEFGHPPNTYEWVGVKHELGIDEKDIIEKEKLVEYVRTYYEHNYSTIKTKNEKSHITKISDIFKISEFEFYYHFGCFDAALVEIGEKTTWKRVGRAEPEKVKELLNCGLKIESESDKYTTTVKRNLSIDIMESLPKEIDKV